MYDEPRRFSARRSSRGGEVVIRLGGDCDASSLPGLNELLHGVVAAEPREVVVDLEHVTFIDSVTLASLTAAAKRVRQHGGSFRVVRAAASEVRRAFEVTGLDKYLLLSAQD